MAEEHPIHQKVNEEAQQEQEQRQGHEHAWHRPRLERLRVSLDTAYNGGSAIDSLQGSTPG